MPFVTEEIYQKLPIKDAESIMVSSYPVFEKKLVFELEEEIVDDEIEFIRNFRNVKAENNITKDMQVMFDTSDNNELIVKMLKLENNITNKPLGINAYKVFSNHVKATIYFEKKMSQEEEQNRKKQIEQLKASIERRQKLLSNSNYVNKAPKNVVELDKQKLEEELKKLKELEKK